MPAAGAVAGLALSGATTIGGVIGTGIPYAAVGAAGGSLLKSTLQPDQPDIGSLAKNLRTETPKTTIEEVEASEQGFARIRDKAAGRRATILTSPQLVGRQPQIRKATLLGG